jgi:mRNA interferase RelE/StbE
VRWELLVTKSAQRELDRLPVKDREHILAALLEMRNDPFTGDIARLKGTRFGWRRRVGNYRILYELHVQVHQIVVSGIRRRTPTTY